MLRLVKMQKWTYWAWVQKLLARAASVKKKGRGSATQVERVREVESVTQDNETIPQWAQLAVPLGNEVVDECAFLLGGLGMAGLFVPWLSFEYGWRSWQQPLSKVIEAKE